MNADILKGQWKQLKGDLQKKWGNLTDDHLTEINGDRTKLVGKVQEAYGIAVEDAEKQVAEFEKAYDKNKAA